MAASECWNVLVPLPPEVLEPVRRQLGVAHGVLDIFVAQIGLQRPRIVALVGQREAAGMAQHVRMGLEVEAAAPPARSTMRAKPAVVNGAPRSDVNTNGDLGSCSRAKRRSARNSSPRIGWVLGVPFLTRRTARVA